MALTLETAERLAKLCGMFGSAHAGERAAAAAKAHDLIRSLRLTWFDVIAPPPAISRRRREPDSAGAEGEQAQAENDRGEASEAARVIHHTPRSAHRLGMQIRAWPLVLPEAVREARAGSRRDRREAPLA